jgi:hypothetical protein
MARKSELDLEIADMLEFYQAAAARSDLHVADAHAGARDQSAASSHAVFSAHGSSRPDAPTDQRHHR